MAQNVLLVDDDQNIIDALKRILRKEPYQIYSVNSAHEALGVVQGISVDVVVTDEQMPGMSGTDLLRMLREQHPEIVAIMLTGKPSLEVALEAINQGEIYRFFTKPCNEVDLALAIREALKQRELISQSRKLVDVMRMQSKYIEALKRENPGITEVRRTNTGAVICDSGLSLHEAVKEVTQALEQAEQRLGMRKIK